VKLFFTCWLIYKDYLEEAALLARYQWGLDIRFFEILKHGYHYIYTFFVIKDTAHLHLLWLNQYELGKLRFEDPIQYETAKEIRNKFNSYFSNLKSRLVKKLVIIFKTPQSELKSTSELRARIRNLYGIFTSELLLAGHENDVAFLPDLEL